MCCSRGPTLGLRLNCDPVGAIAAGEAARQLMYARRISGLRIELMPWLHRRAKPSRLAARSSRQEP